MQVGRNGMLREMFMVKVSHANLHGHFYLKFSCIMVKNGQTYLKKSCVPLNFLAFQYYCKTMESTEREGGMGTKQANPANEGLLKVKNKL